MGVLHSLEYNYHSFETLRRLSECDLSDVNEAPAVLAFLEGVNAREIIDGLELFTLVSRATMFNTTAVAIHCYTSEIPFARLCDDDKRFFAHVYALVLFMRCMTRSQPPANVFRHSDLLSIACPPEQTDELMACLDSIEIVPTCVEEREPCVTIDGPTAIVDRLDRIEAMLLQLCESTNACTHDCQ